jgi:hypothetical protein
MGRASKAEVHDRGVYADSKTVRNGDGSAWLGGLRTIAEASVGDNTSTSAVGHRSSAFTSD